MVEVPAGKIMTSIILIIVAVIVILSVVGATAGNMETAAEAVTSPNECATSLGVNSETLFFNSTTQTCYNSSGESTTSPNLAALPLANLFANNGVVFLIYMAAILLLVIGVVMLIMNLKAIR